MEKIKLKQAVIVEGKYDKIKLCSMVDALIITTDGFSVFKDKEKLALIRALAEKDGIIILTDSDSAGFKIRSYIKGCAKNGKITNVYIPDIFGKEKRKTAPSKEGKLGVEGVPRAVIEDALRKAGVVTGSPSSEKTGEITRAMLMDDGFIGRDGADARRKKLLKLLELPEMLSTASMLEVLNSLFSPDEYKEMVKKLD